MTPNDDARAERLDRQFRFLLELDKLKRVERQNVLSDYSRRENSAEHSWHLAVLALCLAEHAAQPTVDLFKVIWMLLVHDIVEIDAGDAFLHDPAELAAQASREQAAAERIFGLLPPDQAEVWLGLWREFEAGESAESRVARAFDRVHPALLHEAPDANTWRRHGTTHDQIQTRLAVVQDVSPPLWKRLQRLIAQARQSGALR
jgi:putative hydrolase of HD superfamily